MVKSSGFDDAELAKFRNVQRLAYACAEAVGGSLHEGVTEIEAAGRLRSYLEAHGVETHFHKPFAWFGDRTAFRGFRTDLEFFPTRRKLTLGMPVILDVAPVVDGYAADIGYSFTFGGGAADEVASTMRRDLITVRTLIRDGIEARRSFKSVYVEVDQFLARCGYTSAHRIYPERVLAHRLVRVSPSSRSKLHLFGFGVDQLSWLVPGLVRGRVAPSRSDSPLWNDGAESDHAPLTGLWAVEPHFARGGIGAKWEEILVITENDAYWLDDEVPHMREAKSRHWIGGGDRAVAS